MSETDPVAAPEPPPAAASRRLPGLWFAIPLAAFLIVDLATKYGIFQGRSAAEARPAWAEVAWIEPHVNKGVAWSMFDEHPEVVAILTMILIPVLAVVYWRWFRGQGRWSELAFGSILGGALGNGYDRFRAMFPGDPTGGVRDFLLFDLGFWPANPWPAFNIADVGITVGFVALVIAQWRLDQARKRAEQAAT